MGLWQWQELLDACGTKGPHSGPDIDGICIDSRTASAGDLFIALAGDPGPSFHSSSSTIRDGHEFIGHAIENGAAAALVSKVSKASEDTAFSSDFPMLRVENTLDGLWCLGRFARRRMSGSVIAVTGSSGKTTARYWLQELLQAQDKTHASRGSLNNHWGVPLSLARMPCDSSFGIFEIGTNRPGEVLALARVVNPDVAILLNVLPAHIGYFGSLDAIRREKLTIASGLKENGTLIVPEGLDLTGIDHDFSQHDVVSFGTTSAADVWGSVQNHGLYSKVQAKLFGTAVDYTLEVAGEHRVLTSLAVLAAIYSIGADVRQAAQDFVKLTPPDGRGNVFSVAGITIIDDSYNANPVSMAYAIETLIKQQTSSRRIALLGEMLELGSHSDSCHADVVRQVEPLDGVITVGEGFAKYPGKWGHVDRVADLDLESLRELFRPGDVVLIKGSNKVFWATGFVSILSRILGGESC